MEHLHVSPSTVAAIMGAPEFPALAEEYAAESATKGLPPPDAKIELYLRMEAFDVIHAFSAVLDGKLVGFISFLAPPLLHFSTMIAVSESYFVARKHRPSGAGLRLLRAAEIKAKELGSPVLMVSAPVGSNLAEVLPRRGYTESSRVFFKVLADA